MCLCLNRPKPSTSMQREPSISTTSPASQFSQARYSGLSLSLSLSLSRSLSHVARPLLFWDHTSYLTSMSFKICFWVMSWLQSYPLNKCTNPYVCIVWIVDCIVSVILPFGNSYFSWRVLFFCFHCCSFSFMWLCLLKRMKNMKTNPESPTTEETNMKQFKEVGLGHLALKIS